MGGGRHRLPQGRQVLGGVQRQYSGTLGKTANCQLGVSVNAVTEHASCPLDWRLFLPERWDEAAMAARRAACQLPEQIHHRPKWQLVVDMLDELAGWGLSPPVLLADSGYGEVGEFRAGLEARQLLYVVEVRADTSAYPQQVRPTVAPHKGRGRRPRPRYRDQPSSLTELATSAGEQACVELIWRRGSKGLQRGRFLALRVRPAGVTPRRLARAAGQELPVRWLLAEWPPGKPEPTKYWLSNLPETAPLVELVGLARLRWRVEQDYRELKGGLGLDHFEGRGWVGWHHHVTLVSIAHGFLTLERLRGPKPAASA
jgi:SRSO17 transposase